MSSTADLTGIPEWAHPGQKIALVSVTRTRPGASITVATVERATKTLLVLDAGKGRIKRSVFANDQVDLATTTESTSAWNTTHLTIAPVRHPDVLAARAANQVLRAERYITTAHDDWALVIRDQGDTARRVAAAKHLRDAVAAYLDLTAEDPQD